MGKKKKGQQSDDWENDAEAIAQEANAENDRAAEEAKIDALFAEAIARGKGDMVAGLQTRKAATDGGAAGDLGGPIDGTAESPVASGIAHWDHRNIYDGLFASFLATSTADGGGTPRAEFHLGANHPRGATAYASPGHPSYDFDLPLQGERYGAFALVVLVITQASVDASRGGARGAAAAAAVLAALAAGAVVAIAAARRVALGAEWALAPAPSDVSYAWLSRLLLAE